MYLAVSTRTDMAQALNVLARFFENHKKQHLTAARHLLAYLKKTVDMAYVLVRVNQTTGWVMRIQILLAI